MNSLLTYLIVLVIDGSSELSTWWDFSLTIYPCLHVGSEMVASGRAWIILIIKQVIIISAII